MADKTSAEEFKRFIRDLGIRAFDQFASSITTASETATRRANSLSRLASYWSGLKPAEKEQFFEQMITAAQNEVAADEIRPARNITEDAEKKPRKAKTKSKKKSK